jgi:quinol monooxygenase YgiN
MPNVWTHGTWIVKPGAEDAFVAAWTELARAGSDEVSPPAPPTLLRDRDRPNVFVSFGPWRDDAEVERFRASDAFARAREAMRDVLESFEPLTLDEVWAG